MRRMPRYFLNLRNGNHYLPDLEGCDLPHLEAAPIHAVGVAREMMRRPGRRWDEAAFEITNSDRRLVLYLRFADVPR